MLNVLPSVVPKNDYLFFFLLQFVVVFLICQHEAQKHNETELMKGRSEQDMGKSSRLELMLSPPGGDDVTNGP